jgi:hypothetical protein
MDMSQERTAIRRAEVTDLPNVETDALLTTGAAFL